jgi:hypothetical protein
MSNFNVNPSEFDCILDEIDNLKTKVDDLINHYKLLRDKITAKDTIINLAEMRIIVKDSIIGKYVSKENTYKGIVKNQEIQINDWKHQYDKLMIDNKKLKVKGKIGAIKSVIVGVAVGVAIGVIAH